MNNRYRLYRRQGIYCIEDTQNRKQISLRTREPKEAARLLHARNEAARMPMLNLALGKTYLSAHDPKLITRTWAEVMADLATHGRESSQHRCRREMQSRVYDPIRNKTLMETTSEDFKTVLATGASATNNYLRRLHNLALGLGWLAWQILPPKLWPKFKPKPKRAVTLLEYQRIIAAETNVERRLYYGLLWELGAAQTDTANLTADNIDWNTRTIVYRRQKLAEGSEPACMTIGAGLEAILSQLPAQGRLFPSLSNSTDSARAAEFSRRCRLLGIAGISLHSFRYSWAERASTAGYPERWAQAALGHNSRAVHQSYARRAKVICPPLDQYENKVIPLAVRTNPQVDAAVAS
ncbi:MAG: hypothetical protein JWR19_831 [Pedosphaera sp.]|nr:hypothetical protein [Pedosphaera sp.]